MELDYKTIGERLKLAREAQGLTQEECAHFLGLKGSAGYRNYEKGQRRISISQLAKFAVLLKRSVEWFFPPGVIPRVETERGPAVANTDGAVSKTGDPVKEHQVNKAYDLASGAVNVFNGPLAVITHINTRSPGQIWLMALGSLQVQVSPANYTTWLQDTIGLSYDNGLFVVGVPHAFGAEWLQRRLHALVRRTLIDITGHDLEVEFRVFSAPIVTTQTADVIIPTDPDPIPVSSGSLNPRYNFDAFVVGDSNRLAYTACRDACENPGQEYNPLFIYAGPGLGKTHLLHAIGHTCRSKKMRGAYISAERFTNEYIDAIQERQTKDFRQRYRDLDFLLVDDLSFLCGKDKTEETFFYTFNELHNANRQIVVTCDRQPQELPLIKERLRSRLEWGLVVNIQPPEYETRLAILGARARQICPDIPREILDLICQQAGPSVRELEGCLNQVVATARVMKAPLTLDATLKILSGKEDVHQDIPAITTEKVLALVAEQFDIKEDALTGRQRNSQVTQARQIAILILREETNQPLTEIGRLLGNRDHSTIIYSYKRALQEIENNPELGQVVHAVKTRLRAVE